MTAANTQAVTASADAELRGDFDAALRLHRSVPMFSRSTHGDRLQLMAELGGEAPGWLVSRWLTVLARRRQWTGGDEAASNRVLQFVVPIVYPDHIPFDRIGCEHVELVIPYINERDWVVRQVDLYELGALRKLLGKVAPELANRADQVDAWCSAPMGAFRVEGAKDASGRAVWVTDLSDSSVRELLDLGLSELVAPGEHVLGRVVPTTAGPGAMFEWQPLPVSKRTARAVAADPPGWLATLHRLAVIGDLEPGYSHQLETSVTSDLPRHAWMTLVGVPHEDVAEHDPRDVVVPALQEALALAARGAEAVVPRRHEISELLLDAAMSDKVRWQFVSADRLAAWLVLTDVLAEPAASRCRQLAMWCDAAPDLPEAIG